jgi:hypothetical protein
LLHPGGTPQLCEATTDAVGRHHREHAHRCLAPSDFGFHNALITDNGAIKFIDFEYAGWDDPGKMVADFFCQPERPVPFDFFEDFAQRVAFTTSDPKWHHRRFRLLLPVYRLKWCMIRLNDFLAVGGQRRRYACQEVEEDQRKRHQLESSRVALELLAQESDMSWVA